MSELAIRFDAYNSGVLSEALSRVHSAQPAGEVCVGVSTRESSTVVTVDSSGRTLSSDTGATRGPLGCVAKVLTGTLALRAAADGRIDFGRSLSEVDEKFSSSRSAGTTVRQLLSHTHGLDASHIGRIALAPDGRIDLRALSKSLDEAGRLFDAGTLYSYSNGGPWLIAALLENVYSAEFADLLDSKVLRPAGVEIARNRETGSFWCPATGGDLCLSVPELLRFLRWFMTQEDLRKHAELRVSVSPPGWCFERGSCAGWKYFGAGWYGHQMAIEQHSLAVRAHFDDGIAIVVAARQTSMDGAGMTLLRIFGRLLPEFLEMRVPRALRTPIVMHDAARCVGSYGDRATTVRVVLDGNAGLRAEIVRENEPLMRVALKPGTEGAYLAGSVAFQFLSLRDHGYTHLWNGRQVLRRI